MDDFFVVLGGISNNDIAGISIAEVPSIPAPVERVNVYNRANNSDLYESTGIFEDITFSLKLNYCKDDLYEFNSVWRELKKWLLRRKSNKLQFSDDMQHFYLIKKIEMSELARQELYEFGSTTVLITTEAYSYLESGLDPFLVYKTGSILFNDYEESRPKFIIKGDGYLTLTINSKDIKVNVGQQVTIDTKLEMCFKNDTLINLPFENGTFEDMYLREGKNTISYSLISGSIESVEIIPNLREL